MLFPSWDKRHPPQGSSTHNAQIDPQRLQGGKLQRSMAALRCVEKMGPGTAMREPPAADWESSLLPWELYFCVHFSGQLRKAHKNEGPRGRRIDARANQGLIGPKLWSLLMRQPHPKVKQKEIPHLHDSLVHYKQADSYRRASTENQTADKGLQAARYHRPGARGQPHHAGYRELGRFLPPQWRWEHQIWTPTGSKDIPNLSPRRE